MPKKLNYLLLLLLLPALSCTKYQLDGSIDNPDFIGTWVLPKGDGFSVLEIKPNGKYVLKTTEYRIEANDRKRTYKGILTINDTIIRLERRGIIGEPGFGGGPNLKGELIITTPPTFVDTIYMKETSQAYMVLRYSGTTTRGNTWFLEN